MDLLGLWGSFFSREGGAAMRRPGRLVTDFRAPIRLLVGAPIAPAELTATALRHAVAALRAGRG